MNDPSPPAAPPGARPVPPLPEAPLLPVRRWLFAARERWLTVLVLVVVVCGALGWVLAAQPKVYAATATLVVERSNDRVVDIKQVVDNTVDSSLSDALLLTHIQQIKSSSFLRQVFHSFSAAERAALLAAYPVRGRPGLARDLLAGVSARPEPADDESRFFAYIGRNLRVDRVPRTLLIAVTVRHRDPRLTEFLANRLVDQYIQYLIERSSASNDSALVFLRQQADELRRQVEASEHNLQAYREKNTLVFIEQNQNIVVERVRALSGALTQARVAHLALEGRLAQVQGVMERHDIPRELVSLPEFSGFAAVQRQLDENRAAHDVLAQRYGPLHPKMQDNASLRASLENQRHEQLLSAVADLRNQRDKAVTQENQLAAELAAAERESLRLDQLTVEYNVLQRDVATTRDTYAQILARLNETTISSRLQNTNIKFFDRAGLPSAPVEPNPLLIALTLAGAAGLIVVGYPLGSDMLERRLRGSTDVENYLGAPLAAIVPRVRRVRARDRARIVQDSLDEDVAEAFRSLYSHVHLAGRGLPTTLLVTSTIPGEGKSFVAANLAEAFAAHGHRTLLIDADFRRPTLHRSFGLDNQAGLLPWLASTAAPEVAGGLDPALGLRDLGGGLTLLRAGGESRRVTELLGQPRMEQLVLTLQQHFDVLVIDSSPAGVFPDADACVRFCHEFLYVCRFKSADRAHVFQTLQRLRQRPIRFLGVALNSIPGGAVGEYYFSGRARGRRHYKEYYHRAA